jgi:TetR/AcrR family transcriptional regulator, regulator of autoinduction and epiphytic fitness
VRVSKREDARIVESRRRVHAAALAELVEVGYAGMTIDGIAARADVARSTVYRHWSNVRDIVVSALQARSEQPLPRADQTPRERVVALVGHLIDALNGPGGSLAVALAAAAETDPVLRQLHREDNSRRFTALVNAVSDAVPTVDAALAASALAGAVAYRRLILAEPLDTADAEALTSVVLDH